MHHVSSLRASGGPLPHLATSHPSCRPSLNRLPSDLAAADPLASFAASDVSASIIGADGSLMAARSRIDTNASADEPSWLTDANRALQGEVVAALEDSTSTLPGWLRDAEGALSSAAHAPAPPQPPPAAHRALEQHPEGMDARGAYHGTEDERRDEAAAAANNEAAVAAAAAAAAAEARAAAAAETAAAETRAAAAAAEAEARAMALAEELARVKAEQTVHEERAATAEARAERAASILTEELLRVRAETAPPLSPITNAHALPTTPTSNQGDGAGIIDLVTATHARTADAADASEPFDRLLRIAGGSLSLLDAADDSLVCGEWGLAQVADVQQDGATLALTLLPAPTPKRPSLVQRLSSAGMRRQSRSVSAASERAAERTNAPPTAGATYGYEWVTLRVATEERAAELRTLLTRPG
jgi:hypothetical protein